MAAFCTALVIAWSNTTLCSGEERIDRQALVRRHSPLNRSFDPLGPLTVGNGRFAFTADITGLQTFADEYESGIPLSTQSQWGWHTFPSKIDYELAEASQEYDTYGRQVPYASLAETEAGKWLRSNPHRLGLGRIGLEYMTANSNRLELKDLTDIEQTLDLWTGQLVSQFRINGEPVRVETVCHPAEDTLAIRVTSPLVATGRLKVAFRFAYGSGEFGKAPEDWTKPEKHKTVWNHSHTSKNQSMSLARLERTLDGTSYCVELGYPNSARLEEKDRHHFELTPSESNQLEFVVRFTPKHGESLPTVAEIQKVAAEHWQNFWQSGGAIELAGSKDPRAKELERRIVLSQYLLALQCAGDLPPQETGLTFNSWFGKSHLEMHWWHAVQFALWDRLDMLEKSLPWYGEILPKARETAERQGYKGARWPKMVGPDGRESPSTVGVFLVWQQPHPIYYAELCYRQRPTVETLKKYRDIVYATADFMASYAYWDEKTERYVLGPPLIPAQEHYDPRTTINPTFELEYWHWALGIAREWRKRLGDESSDEWDRMHAGLAKLPITEGVYDTAEGMWITTDHPSHLAALGMLPGERVDLSTMRRTLRRVAREWQWDKTWGWDYPMAAMTAARMGGTEHAIDLLMMDVAKNRYLANGHNHQDDRLPIYLPGNGALLTAVAMMAAGWDGAPSEQHAPGFPDNGKWEVRWENLHRLP